jgi:2-oxoglutarate dehydrogenase E2 component (dihydrolipoamide succinyltransferase)
MTVELKVPYLGEGISRVTVCSWHHQQGDVVACGDDVVEVEADKAIFNISCEDRGCLKEILAPEGKEVSVGQTIAIIEKI